MTNNNSFNDLAGAVAGIRDVKTMKRFFREIFTEAEVSDIALRWRLMKMLLTNIPQRKIASDLRISLCKITRGSRVLKNRHSITKTLLHKSL